MFRRSEAGFTLMEALVVMAIIGITAVIGWSALAGYRERNALTMVSRDVRYVMEKYRQRAMDKGYNYGLIFSDDGIYAFEDNGGNSATRFQAMNNYAVDPGEFSDQADPGASGGRGARRVSSNAGDYKVFTEEGGIGRVMILGLTDLDTDMPRTGGPYDPIGTDLTEQALRSYSGDESAPFDAGSMALFFSPDGRVYLKDPSYVAGPMDKHYYQLENAGINFYVVRIAYDNSDTANAELPYYYELAINRYGAVTYIRWTTNDGGSSWTADVQ